MINNIPEEYQGSAAFQFVISRGWNWKPASFPNIELEECVYCGKGGFGHFYMEIHGPEDGQKSRDGLHMCHRCGKSGGLRSLKEHLGVSIKGVELWSEKKIESLPNIDLCHQALIEDEEAMDYLINGRGFSREIIDKQKIGMVPERYFRECGKVKALVYPYLVNGNCVFVHYRTLPTMPLSSNKVVKAFNSPSGWDPPLYNGEALREGTTEIVFVEGEANCIAAMDKGINNICGVPGANFKKAEWIDTIDKIESLEKIYICYDKDKVGQRAAQALASRIGTERCWKIILPDFTYTDPETGELKTGKDLNEWFVHGGGTAEWFNALKEEAKQFDVDGVSSTEDAIQELYDQIVGKETMGPKYKTPWESLNKLVGFEDGDVIDIVAPEKIGKTTFGMNLLEHMVDIYGEDGIIICLEMTVVRLVRKWIAHVAQIEDNIPNTVEEAKQLRENFIKAISLAKHKASNRAGNLYFCYPKYKTVDDIYNLIRQVIRRYGVKWVMLDNIQRLSDSTLGNKNRTHHLSEISKVLSQIAKDYNIQMVRILQPHRIQEGKMITTDDVDGASQIAKDCDAMITLHRSREGVISAQVFESSGHIESKSSFKSETLISVGLSRYSSGGYTTLDCDGARSTFNERDPVKAAFIKATANKDVGYGAQLQALIGNNIEINP